MPKTYVPSMVRDIHQLALYLVRYNSVIRVALGVLDPDSVSLYDSLYSAVLALDALRETLAPELPDA